VPTAGGIYTSNEWRTEYLTHTRGKIAVNAGGAERVLVSFQLDRGSNPSRAAVFGGSHVPARGVLISMIRP